MHRGTVSASFVGPEYILSICSIRFEGQKDDIAPPFKSCEELLKMNEELTRDPRINVRSVKHRWQY